MAESTTGAEQVFRIGPLPEWATTDPIPTGFAARPGDAVTHLLIEQQIDATKKMICTRRAIRLETMAAVQHESQWKFDFHPRTDRVSLHWIRILRGPAVFEKADPVKIRLLQREEGLEGHVITGTTTALLIIDDVRVGDILETCLTIESHHQICPDHFEKTFYLAAESPIAKYRFRVRAGQIGLRWLASPPDQVPVIRNEEAGEVWEWTGENYITPKLENNTPNWFIDCPWIQVSNSPDWQSVAAAVSQAWEKSAEEIDLAEIVRELGGSDSGLEERVEKAIQFVQDEHRYLSVNLELGGQIPTAPTVVAGRRYGDCKDLSLLLVHLLWQLGVSAYPVLVHSIARKSIADKLPSPNLFNHVIVQFHLGEETRWIDVTIDRQGGGPLGRFVPLFYYGLVIHPSVTTLSSQPNPVPDSSFWEVTETLLLDTTGEPSLLASQVRARGFQADVLRHKLEALSEEEFRNERLEFYKGRYSNIKSTSSIQTRDNRAANEFLLSQVFEINGFLLPGTNHFTCIYRYDDHLIYRNFPQIEEKERRTPFALAYPSHLVHSLQIESPDLPIIGTQRGEESSPFLDFHYSIKTVPGQWALRLELEVRADAVYPAQLTEYRKAIQDIARHLDWTFSLPMGRSHQRPRKDFGDLPPVPGAGATQTDNLKLHRRPMGERPAARPRELTPAFTNRLTTPAPEVTSRSEGKRMHRRNSEGPLQDKKVASRQQTEHRDRAQRRSWKKRPSFIGPVIGAIVLVIIIFAVIVIRLFVR